ncbi:MAG: DUF7144 family membrane protein [Infirmifilum sp.]
MSEQPPQLPPPPPPPPPPKQRPLGITILSILGFISAALFILAGISFIVLGPLITHELAAMGARAFVLAVAGALGFFFLVSGGIAFLVSWGLWKGKSWAWWLSVILGILSLLSSLVNIAMGEITSLVSLVIDAVILYYFFKPHVKDFFGVKVSFST